MNLKFYVQGKGFSFPSPQGMATAHTPKFLPTYFLNAHSEVPNLLVISKWSSKINSQSQILVYATNYEKMYQSIKTKIKKKKSYYEK